MKQIQYRDTKTGKFIGKSTWKRSKGQGGKRYKREIIEHKPKKKVVPPPPPPPPPPEPQFETWVITFRYP